MIIERGSRWRWKGDDGQFFTAGREYTVLSDGKPGEMFELEDDIRDSGSPHHWTNDQSFFDSFERVDGPVRTVTRKEIVPGEYGIVRVNGDYSISFISSRDPSELRAAAATLIEIADALGDTK